MWLLIECDDPVTGPGHDEKRRILIDEDSIRLGTNFNHGKTLAERLQIKFEGSGLDTHPFTPGDDGYHCPICHKDIKPKNEEDNDTKLTDIEKLDELATEIINHYSDELKGLKRYNSLTVLAQKFRLFESECTRRMFSSIKGRDCSEVIVDEGINHDQIETTNSD